MNLKKTLSILIIILVILLGYLYLLQKDRTNNLPPLQNNKNSLRPPPDELHSFDPLSDDVIFKIKSVDINGKIMTLDPVFPTGISDNEILQIRKR